MIENNLKLRHLWKWWGWLTLYLYWNL